MSKLKLPTNLPVTIALKFTKGTVVTGDYGDQMLYTLADGQRWYAPLPVADKVDALQLVAGELFTVTKCESENNRIRYEVQRATQTQPLSSQRLATPRAETASRAIAQQPQNTSGIREYSPIAKRLMLAFRDALDVANEVEKHAHARSFDLDLSSAECIRALATTLFIQGEKEARY